MVRLILSVVLIVHGLIHLIGFSREWNLGPVPPAKRALLFPLSGAAVKVAGVVWLLACILFVGCAIMFFMGYPWWVICGIIGVIVSQGIIVVYWREAKWGTIVNGVLLVMLYIQSGIHSFERESANDAQRIRSRAEVERNERYTQKELPEIVRKWMSKSVVSKPYRIIAMKQTGKIRMEPEGKWVSYSAEQTSTIDPPAFVWTAGIQMVPLTVAARDKYENGRGNMLIKPLYVYTMANASGPEIDQGTLLRFLGEMIWYPQAASSKYLSWTSLDDERVSATMTYGGVTASGIFTFDKMGTVISFSADRFGEFNGQLRKEKWEVTITGYKQVDDVFIPATCDVTWKLKEGDYTWLKLEITSITYK